MPRSRTCCFALVVLALLAAGCGAAGSPGKGVAQLGSTNTTATTDGAGGTRAGKLAAAFAYSSCMRSHGVRGFPDPRRVGGGFQIGSSETDSHSPAYTSAQRTCRHLLPGGGSPSRADRQRALAEMLRSAQCMRAHGISGFPDPTQSEPKNPADYSAIMGTNGVWLAIPSRIDVRSPTFVRAAAACKLPLTPPRS